MKSEIFLPLVFTLTVAVAEGEVRKRHCKPGYFVDTTIRGCKKCSVCPQNQIIRRPCDDTNDVFCDDFTEFNEFNQHQELTLANTTATDANHNDQQNSMSSEIGWRKLSMALVIVLSLGLVFLSAGILAFYFWRKRQAAAKEISTVIYERDPLTSDVTVQTPEPTFRGETSTSQLEAATFTPQPSTSGERKRSPKKNDYVKLFRPTEKRSGEIDLDLEERIVGFSPSDTQDTVPSATINL